MHILKMKKNYIFLFLFLKKRKDNRLFINSIIEIKTILRIFLPNTFYFACIFKNCFQALFYKTILKKPKIENTNKHTLIYPF